MIAKILVLFLLCVTPGAVRAQERVPVVPTEVRPFVGRDRAVLALESADLNGDRRGDYILVVESSAPQTAGNDLRTLIIITRRADGSLTSAKSNDRVVLCRTCGGAFGDPFDGVYAERNSFTVNNYGGSWQRWNVTYKFDYSRRDRTWQLVEIYRSEYDSHDPQDESSSKSKSLTPRSFGKVDIADFDPDQVARSMSRRLRSKGRGKTAL